MRIKTAIMGAALVLGASVASTAPAFAQKGNVSAANPQSVASAMTGLGYTNTLTKDDLGDPMVEAEMGGWKVRVLFYDCTEGKNCQSLQFFAIFDSEKGMDPRRALGWPKDYRFGAVALDAEDDPIITWDIVTGNQGIPLDTFNTAAKKFESAVSSFGAYVFEGS